KRSTDVFGRGNDDSEDSKHGDRRSVTVSDEVSNAAAAETASLGDAAVAFLGDEFLSACESGGEVCGAGLDASGCGAGCRGRDEGVGGFPGSGTRTGLGVLSAAFQL